MKNLERIRQANQGHFFFRGDKVAAKEAKKNYGELLVLNKKLVPLSHMRMRPGSFQAMSLIRSFLSLIEDNWEF